MVQAIYNRAARFIQKSGEVDSELVSFGTGVLFVGEAARLDRLLFRAVPLKDAFLVANDEGDVDTVYIRSRLTARQAAQRYGRDNLGDKTKEALDGQKPEQRFVFLQAVMPRAERDPRRRDNANLPFASIHIDVESEHRIGAGGFHEFPFAVPRCRRALPAISPGNRCGTRTTTHMPMSTFQLPMTALRVLTLAPR